MNEVSTPVFKKLLEEGFGAPLEPFGFVHLQKLQFIRQRVPHITDVFHVSIIKGSTRVFWGISLDFVPVIWPSENSVFRWKDSSVEYRSDLEYDPVNYETYGWQR